MEDRINVPISSDTDIVTARQKGRELAAQIGFTTTDLAIIATAISELARNIVSYAKTGEVVISVLQQGIKHGIRIVAKDKGPGIPDIEQAMKDGYSTAKGLGLGLPGTKRLMDEFEIVSAVGNGTTVTVKKWRR
jgi:serine/threonine-protein kinase RsbT